MSEVNVMSGVSKESNAGVKQLNRISKMQEIEKQNGFLLGISILFGLLYAFCLYKNWAGITFPFFVMGGYGLCILTLKKLSVKVKKESWFLVVVSVLLAVSTCRTGDDFIIIVNRLVIFLLACIYLLHHFYSDISWNIGKYVASIFMLLGTAVTLIKYPGSHFVNYVSRIKDRRGRFVILAGIGVGCSVPVVILLVVLLGQADAVFLQATEYIMDTFLRPWTVISVMFKIFVGTMTIYCLICAAHMKNISEETGNKRTREPIIAISGLSIIAVIYILFSGIQIIYLFMGAGKLPEGISYSSYARQGFFQLVFVAFLNLFIVLLSLKYFKKNIILNLILTVISACTYVMLASAACRMLLYVGEYHLTYLRLLVLWFLVLLAVLLVGVIAVIYKNQFPLFRYFLVAVSVFYLGFAWMKPDYVIARYNMAHMQSMDSENLKYFRYALSVDAAPVLAEFGDKELLENYYNFRVAAYADNWNFRTYNFSYAKAMKVLKE